MHQGLANDQMDHDRHQLMLKQATAHIRPGLCDTQVSNSEAQTPKGSCYKQLVII
jgi:hypothetical protein